MLLYSCSNSRLLNWVLRQVGEQPGLVFPRHKGWNAYLKTRYPSGSEQGYATVVVANLSETLIFIPLDDRSDAQSIKQLTARPVVRQLMQDLGLKPNSYQCIFICCERDRDYLMKLLKEALKSFNLLMLDYERMSFVEGNFKNPRLEFRLSSQEFDIDLIPDFVPDDRISATDGMSRSLFYHSMIHSMNIYWFAGKKSVALRRMLKELLPCWNHYRKSFQQDLIDRVSNHLDEIFSTVFENGFAIKEYKRKKTSHPELTVFFPEVPLNRKEMNAWLRKQNQALEFLKDEGEQISIDFAGIGAGF